MADKVLQIINNRKTEVEATVVSTGVSNAGDVVALNDQGTLDESVMPPGIGADVAVIEASESLDAGDFVNIFDDGGTAKVRKADASAANAGEIAHGFVLDTVTSGNDATVYFEGSNNQLSGLVPGTAYVLSHSAPGEVVTLSNGTTTAGHSLQFVGKAVSATVINVELGEPVIRG